MLPLSAAGKRAFKTKTHMNLIIEFSDGTVLTNEDINSGTFTIEQSLCEEEQLTYGQVNSARFSVQVLKTEHRYLNLQCSVYMCSGYEDIDTDVYKVPVGQFTITNDERSDNRRYRTIEGYDAIYINAEKDVDTWYENLSLPMTLKQFRDSLFAYMGIPQVDTELINDDLIIQRTVAAQTGPFTFLQVIEAICEVSATFGFIGQDGVFRYVTFEAVDYDELTQSFIFHKNRGVYDAETQTLELANGSAVYLPESETIMFRSNDFAVSDKQDIRQGSLIYKDYVVRPIEKIQIREDEQDYGTLYPNSAEAVNTYVITGNFLLYGNDYDTNYEVAKNIYEIAHGLTYVPLQVEVVGMPWVELGDWVEIQGVNNTFLIPILMRTMNGIVNYTDKYEARGTEYSSAQNNGIQAYIRQLKSKYLKLGATVDQAFIEIGALKNEDTRIYSRITMNAEAIQAEVVRASNSEGTLSSRITMTADAITSEVQRAQTQEQSIITQTAQQLNLKVSKASAISEINLCPENATINAQKINLNGYTSINENFNIDTEGKFHCVDGEFSGTLDGVNYLADQIIISSSEQNVLTLANRKQGKNPITYRVNPVQNLYTEYGLVYNPGSDSQLSRIGNSVRSYYSIEYGGTKYTTNVYSDGVLVSASSYNPSSVELTWNKISAFDNAYPEAGDNGFVEIAFDAINRVAWLKGTWYGSLSNSSDKRLKKNIENLVQSLISAVGSVEIKQFYFTKEENGTKLNVGIIAQDLIEAGKDEGIDVEEYDMVSKNKEGYYAVNYNQFLLARNAYLEQKVDALEERLARLEKLLEV